MEYSFSKDKLPQGFSFPLKRSVLNRALEQAGVRELAFVFFNLGRPGRTPLAWVEYISEDFGGFAAGKTSLTLHAVPSSKRNEIEHLLLSDGLPKVCAWLTAAENAGNAWRGMKHQLTIEYRDDALVCSEE